jgi:hypothetical protein
MFAAAVAAKPAARFMVRRRSRVGETAPGARLVSGNFLPLATVVWLFCSAILGETELIPLYCVAAPSTIKIRLVADLCLIGLIAS